MDRELFHSKIKSLIHKFETNKYHYLSKNYLEEEVKIDFINPLFEALGWDIRNTKGLSPYERDVVVEKGETLGRPDYNFRIDGQTKFFIEAKAPHEPLHKINHVLQAKSYAWNTKSVFMVLLTDFEEFRLFDATIKPDSKNADQGLIFELTYDQYLDNLDKLSLLSKEEAEKGSLDKLLLRDSTSRKLRKPVDEAFLEDLSSWREELAKDIYKNNIKDLEDITDEGKTKIQIKILNEAVQKILDRLIFIRIAEDRKTIEPKSLLDEVEWWKAGGKRRDLQRRLTNRFMGWNQDFNGEILKPGPCDILEISSGLLAKIIEGLYFPKCPYRFEVMGVELLGSIYERYLGKTIRVTPKRVKIEEKPEVRKAGGVYYTPQYIVDYIVKNTVGKIIKAKTPKQIEKIKILDPACGSGSFLLTAFQTLIDYHLNYYEKHPEESGKGTLFPDLITDFNDTKRLSIEKKAQILKNNIFGVDIDAQAVEIAMMSLYLKCLEGERDLPRKKELLPSLVKNIRCGNSLISYDIYDQKTLFDNEEKEQINPFDWNSKTTGFGDIMELGGFNLVIGNPPYRMLQPHNTTKEILNYLRKHFVAADFKIDFFHLFLQKGIASLVKRNGHLGFIVPVTLLNNVYIKSLRLWITERSCIESIYIANEKVFTADVHTLVIILRTESYEKKRRENEIHTTTNLNESFVYRKDNVFSKTKQKEILKLPGYVWNVMINKRNSDIIFRLIFQNKSLGEIAKINRGLITGNRKKYFTFERKSEFHKPIIAGADVFRFFNKEPTEFVFFKRPTTAGGCWDQEMHDAPYKIVIRQIGRRPIATIIREPWAITGNIFSIRLDNLENEKFLLGIINSKLINFFWRIMFTDFKTSFPQVTIYSLSKIPIRRIDHSKKVENILQSKMIRLVDNMLNLNKTKNSLLKSSKRDRIEREIQITDEKIDELVYEIYGITEEERKVVEEEI